MAKRVKQQTVEATENVSSTKAMKRGTIIQAVKAVAVLVCICLVCGALLALCNEVFYISDQERFNRSMAKIYPELDVNAVDNIELNPEFVKGPYGEVKSVVTDGKVYILEAKSSAVGYEDGTVTLYVIVDKDAKIVSWVVKEHEKQSFMDHVPSSAGTTWYVGKDVSNALDLEMTGATVVKTSTAIQYAVNAAAYYCRSALGVGEDLETEAKNAVIALLGEGFGSYELETLPLLGASVKIDASTTVKEALTIGNDEISYIMTATGDSGSVTAYVFGEKADTQKIVALVDGTTKTSDNVSADSELVTTVSKFNANIHSVTSGKYSGYGYIVSIETADSFIYTVTGIKIGSIDPNEYVLKVTVTTVDGKGKVSAISIETDGYAGGPGAPSRENASKLATELNGATLETIEGLYSDHKVSGATQSANLIRIAVETALRDYDAKLDSNN